MLQQDIERTGSAIFNGILGDDFLNKLPESIFVGYFLPRFLGDIKDDKWVLEWISIAGTPASPLLIIDDKTRTVLYKVPSLLDTNTLISLNARGTLKAIFLHYNQLGNNLPQVANNFLVNALQTKQQELLSDYKNKESTQMWLNILNRYNIIPKQEVSSAGGDNLTDMMEF